MAKKAESASFDSTQDAQSLPRGKAGKVERAKVKAQKVTEERSSGIQETKDKALNEVLQEAGAGASENELDIESPIGEDKAVEQSAKDKAEELTTDLSSQESDVVSGDVGSSDDWNDKKEKTSKSAKKSTKKVHVEGPRKPAHSKKYLSAIKDLDVAQMYSKEDAVMLVKKTSYSTFDGTVEAHIKIDQQNVRGVVTLPSGTGKTKRIAVFSGVDTDAMIKKIESGVIDFDIAIATPDAMPKLAKVARVLGPRGLMPNPKSGTVTDDVEKAKAEFASGRIEYKQDKGGVVHQSIGKVSMTEEQLLTNLNTLLAVLPIGKITSITLSSTMGPGIKVKI